MHQTTIAGHLGADPEVRFTPSGLKVTTLRVATRVRRSGKDETIWWRVTAWADQFDKIMPYFKKGSPIIVIGEFQKPEIFNDREGKPQVSLNIVAYSIQFSPFGKPDGSGSSSQTSGSGTASNEKAQDFSFAANAVSSGEKGNRVETDSFDEEDEIPF
jgi:single-strand DNA-binding protein